MKLIINGLPLRNTINKKIVTAKIAELITATLGAQYGTGKIIIINESAINITNPSVILSTTIVAKADDLPMGTCLFNIYTLINSPARAGNKLFPR